jgi:GntR family transcriptional regulator
VERSSSLRTPLYHQIFVILRDGILSGHYRLGDLLPTEHEIMLNYDVSRITARRALDELAKLKMVKRSRGRGTSVAYAGAPPTASSSSELSEVESGTAELLQFSCDVAASAQVEALRLSPGAEVQNAVRLRKLGDAPYSHLVTAIPSDIGHRIHADELLTRSPLQILQGHGVIIGSAHQIITATVADQIIGPRLKTEIGSPLLKLMRVVSDNNGRPIEWLTALYRPDKYYIDSSQTADQVVQSM